jgi:hypothetical protein
MGLLVRSEGARGELREEKGTASYVDRSLVDTFVTSTQLPHALFIELDQYLRFRKKIFRSGT